MQRLKAISPYIGDKIFFFFRVGLNVSLCAQAMWQHMERWIKACESVHVDLVDFGPPDHDQMQVINSEPSTALVKSNSCNIIPHSINDSVTRSEVWRL